MRPLPDELAPDELPPAAVGKGSSSSTSFTAGTCKASQYEQSGQCRSISSIYHIEIIWHYSADTSCRPLMGCTGILSSPLEMSLLTTCTCRSHQSMAIGTGSMCQHGNHSGYHLMRREVSHQEQHQFAGRETVMLTCFPRDSMLWFLGALVPPKARLLLSSSAWPGRRITRYLKTSKPSTPFSLQYFTCKRKQQTHRRNLAAR